MTVSSIGSNSRDYATPALWWADCPANLVSATDTWEGEMYNDSEFLLTAIGGYTFSGVTTSATYFAALRPASGEGFADHANKLTNPLRYNVSNGVGIRKTTNYSAPITTNAQQYVYISGLQIHCSASSPAVYMTTGSINCKLNNNILEAAENSYVVSIRGDGTVIANNVIIVLSTAPASCQGVAGLYSRPYIINNTIVALNSSASTGIYKNPSALVVAKNNAIFGFPTAMTAGTWGAGTDYNATDVATLPTGSNNQLSLTFADQFENVASDATLDLRAVATGSLEENGVRDAANTNDLDIVGQSRSITTPTIGAWEVVTAGGGDDLISQDITTGNPIVTTATIGQTHALLAQSIESGTPVVGQPTLGFPENDLTSQDIVTGNPVIDTANIGQIHGLLGQDISTGSPVIDTSLINQVHIVLSQDIVAGQPIIEAPTIGQLQNLLSQDVVTGIPVVGSASIGQIHDLTSQHILTGNPVIDIATIGQVHILLSQDVITGNPVISAPLLVESVDDLVSLDIVTGTPIVDTPTIGQIHNLLSQGVLTGNPVIDASTIGQIHGLLSGDILTGIPVITMPLLVEGVDDLLSQDVITGAPTIDTPIIGQLHTLISQDIVTGSPEIDAPAINQVHDLLSQGLTTGIPLIEVPLINQIHTLLSRDITADSPVVDVATINQIHGLLSQDIVTDNPVIDVSIIGQFHILISQDILTDAPVISMPLLVEGVDDLISQDIVTGQPIVDSAIISQVHILVSQNIITDLSIITVPTLGIVGAPTGSGLTTEEHNKLMSLPTVVEIWAYQNALVKLNFLFSMEGGMWHIEGNQMVFYEDDNLTEVARFNLFDAVSAPTMENVMKRTRV